MRTASLLLTQAAMAAAAGWAGYQVAALQSGAAAPQAARSAPPEQATAPGQTPGASGAPGTSGASGTSGAPSPTGADGSPGRPVPGRAAPAPAAGGNGMPGYGAGPGSAAGGRPPASTAYPAQPGAAAAAATGPGPAAPPPGAAAFGPSFRAAVERAAPSVVTVYSARRLRRGAASDPGSQGLGSGVVLDAAGLVLTNYHVVEGATQLAVALADGSFRPARLAGTDPETDLALLRVEAADLKPIALGDTKRIAVGDVVLAVGNPLGVGQTVTQGIVSATGRRRLGINPIENFVQTDAAINPGNSGGALIDTEGRLIGINSAILSRGGGSEGIGFAIPVELAQQVAASLATHGRVTRGWLGVGAADADSGATGAVITAVQRGGPADRAGLRPGDVVLQLGERPIEDADDLVGATLEIEPGTRIEARLVREGRRLTVPVELGRRPGVRQAAGGR